MEPQLCIVTITAIAIAVISIISSVVMSLF